ncbi:MAG: response regulator transcription factor, partial [Sphingomonadales bacterium]|nr:response regulator transcription factor [Sphingomonadales bacterium]
MHLMMIAEHGAIADRLAERLGKAGYLPVRVSSHREALNADGRESTAAILLDHGPSMGPAARIVEALRQGGWHQPLVVLSPRDDWREKVDCLDAGADDVLAKPVHSEEIAAHLRALIRRNAGMASDRIVTGDLDVDLKAHCAWQNGACLNLTRNEFRLLRLFVLGPDRIVSKEEMAEVLSRPNEVPSSNAIEVQVTRLRRKLGDGSIVSVRGLGYRLTPRPSGSDPIPTRQACGATKAAPAVV